MADRARSIARRALIISVGSCALVACGEKGGRKIAVRRAPAHVADSAPRDSTPRDTTPHVVRVPRPDTLRGLYVNRWAALGDRMWKLVGVARRTEINALVIDVKDDRGFVLYNSRVPLAREIGADTNMPMSQAHDALACVPLSTTRARANNSSCIPLQTPWRAAKPARGAPMGGEIDRFPNPTFSKTLLLQKHV